ncbi:MULTISPECIES: trypsin-like peptidase domain-containing protein [Butyricimonas]|uniref:trypsin-like peptidase domain-containing protein n=1 Tax=Butyricimonas TaxID=574697 RepID=UPI001D06BE62|nr:MULTISPECIES: trypsin-like peptidase domain-containing protein [Butyricimonas]MCB6971376.1 trypsin-like peptidase domain-containing protein [Butyricimonas synergistica]MCG4518090.1 trypsin-like peptidase domain-containing protein [Butyricimonas sp. DFI.6.44]
MEQNIFKAVYKVNHAGGSGSCFYLKNYDLFVTNYHVVEGFREVALQDNDKNRFYARVVLVNPARDIALLKADGDFSALPEIALSALDEVSIGQRINVAGYPFGMPFTVTEGTVSSPRQLMNDSYYIQTDAAVNPGNSGGPMFNDSNELVAITVSKLNNADNMGFGIPVASLRELLEQIADLDTSIFNVQCNSCDEFISEEEEYCPSCGDKLPENVFKERTLTDLAVFCEEAIGAMGINPVLARVGYESWVFHKGSSEIRMFVYNRQYLFCTSPLNVLPKKNLEPVLSYLLNADVRPYQFGLDGNQIYISYRVHISDVFSEYGEEVQKNLTNMAFKADELDNYLADTFGCEFSEYAKKDAI